MSTVVLVGFMGSGKTTVGRLVAEARGCPFVDLDQILVERFRLPLAEVFARHGEPAFRRVEADALRSALATTPVVIATGGGTFSGPNRELLKRADAVTVFLDVPWSVLLRRLAGTEASRPMLGSPAAAHDLLLRRLPGYRQADVTVAVDARATPSEVVDRVSQRLAEASCAT